MTRKEERRRLGRNSSRLRTKQGCKHVSYCPECSSSDLGKPQLGPHITINTLVRFGHCSKGHSWKVTGSIYK